MTENFLKTTRDTLFNGDFVCYQHDKGYRFSVDSILLARLTTLKPKETVLDLGAGCGIVGLLLLFLDPTDTVKVTALELQDSLAKLIEKNINVNDFSSKAHVIAGDATNIKELLPAESFSKVVCNPPFYSRGSGRENIEEEIRIARHQTSETLDNFINAAYYAVKNKGSANFIYPARKLSEITVAAVKKNFSIKRIRPIYSYPHEGLAAKLVFIECIKNGNSECEIESPFYLYAHKNGPYSREMKAYYQT